MAYISITRADLLKRLGEAKIRALVNRWCNQCRSVQEIARAALAKADPRGEWSATRPARAGEAEACCAICGSAKDKGHSPNCTFAKPRGQT